MAGGFGIAGDKRKPCTNCIKANTECVTPASGRSSAKSRRRPDLQRRLVERTAAIEGIVQSLHRSGSSEGPVSPGKYAREGDEAELFRKWRKVAQLKDTFGNRSASAEAHWSYAG